MMIMNHLHSLYTMSNSTEMLIIVSLLGQPALF